MQRPMRGLLLRALPSFGEDHSVSASTGFEFLCPKVKDPGPPLWMQKPLLGVCTKGGRMIPDRFINTCRIYVYYLTISRVRAPESCN